MHVDIYYPPSNTSYYEGTYNSTDTTRAMQHNYYRVLSYLVLLVVIGRLLLVVRSRGVYYVMLSILLFIILNHTGLLIGAVLRTL